MIGRDLMIGNPKLAEMGYVEESCGHNAIAAGFQGQRQWTDHMPNGDMMESILNSSFDWNGIREPFVIATENDMLNGVAMLFGKLLTNTARGLCRRAHLLEPRGRGARDRLEARGPGQGRLHPPDQLRRGDAGRHRRSARSTASPP